MMVNATHLSLASTARRLIKQNGRPMTLNRTDVGFNPATGATVPTTEQQTVTAVFTNYTASQVDGTTIQSGDKRLLVASNDLNNPVDTSWKVLDGIETWNIQNVEEVDPGEVSIIYKLQVRR